MKKFLKENKKVALELVLFRLLCIVILPITILVMAVCYTQSLFVWDINKSWFYKLTKTTSEAYDDFKELSDIYER